MSRAYAAFERRDVDALKALADPDVEVQPLLSEVVAAGPWRGHEAVERLVELAAERWERFSLVPIEVKEDGDGLLVRVRAELVRVRAELVPAGGSTTISGEVVHRLVLRDGKVLRFEAVRA